MTAVEWLVRKIIEMDGQVISYQTITSELVDKAYQMEKEQIIDAHYQGYRNFIDTTEISEQYYNDTYGSKGSDEHIEHNLEEIISKAHTNITRIKGKEYAPTSNEIQAEIEKSEKPINLEISDGEILATAETFWTEEKESDMKRGWKLGAKWYREQLKQRQ